jgi:hypothetical protein
MRCNAKQLFCKSQMRKETVIFISLCKKIKAYHGIYQSGNNALNAGS